MCAKVDNYEKICLDYLNTTQCQSSIFIRFDTQGNAHYMFAVKEMGNDWKFTWIPAQYGVHTVRNGKVVTVTIGGINEK